MKCIRTKQHKVSTKKHTHAHIYIQIYLTDDVNEAVQLMYTTP